MRPMSVGYDHKCMQKTSIVFLPIGLMSKNRIGKSRIEARIALCRAQEARIRITNMDATLQIFSIAFIIIIPAYISNF